MKEKTRQGRPSVNKDDLKDKQFKLSASTNQIKRHGTKDDVYDALHVAIEQPEEMRNLINKLQSDALDECSEEAKPKTN
jgi:hypothetical protein